MHFLFTPTAVLHTPSTAFSDYKFLFTSQRCEAIRPIPLQVNQGSIPVDFPCGTYYLAGPGIFSDDYGSTVHPIDGHGYLRAFEFGPDCTVRYSARYVDTEAKREECDSRTGRWRFTYRGPFSVLQGGKKLGNLKVMKNVANTCVLKWGNRLLCLWEGGEPHEIHPSSLDTIGIVDFIDVDKEEKQHALPLVKRPFLKGVLNMPKRILAHYKIDPTKNRLLLLCCNGEDMFLPQSNFTFYEFDSSFQLVHKREFVIPEHMMIHDWAFTKNHYVILANRIKLDIPGSFVALSGFRPLISALTVDPSKPSTPIYLLPRSTNNVSHDRDWKWPIEAPLQLWTLHVGNAFEETDCHGNTDIQIQASTCSYKWFEFHKMLGYKWNTGGFDPQYMNMVQGEEHLLPHIVQISIKLNRKGEDIGCSVSNPSTNCIKSADFPVINTALSGVRNNYIYAATANGKHNILPHFPYDSIVKFNLSNGSANLWSTDSRAFVGEPVFIPRGTEEDDGYILVVEYAVWKKRCYLVMLDPKRIGQEKAVIARIEVPKHLTFPLGFHGFWSSL